MSYYNILVLFLYSLFIDLLQQDFKFLYFSIYKEFSKILLGLHFEISGTMRVYEELRYVVQVYNGTICHFCFPL